MKNPFRQTQSELLLKPLCLFSVLFALSVTAGKEMYHTNTLFPAFSSPGRAVLFLAETAAVAAVTFLLLLLIFSFLRTGQTARNSGCTFRMRWVWPLIFFCWLPCYLAYYPGVFSYDIITQTAMIMEDNISAVIPPLHTFLWKIFLLLDHTTHSRIVAIVWYSVFQMLAFSAMLADTVSYIHTMTGSRGWAAAALAFFALNPVIALMSFMTTKAVLFSGSFVMASVRLWDLAANTPDFLSSRKKCLSLCFWILIASLFRTNAIFSFLLILPALFLLLKGYRFRAASLIVFPAAVWMLISVFLYPALGIGGTGKNDLLCIPYQQIACAVSRHPDDITDEEATEIGKYTDYGTLARRYNPRFADPVKNEFYVPSSQLKEFFRLWLSLGRKYPSDFLDAFLTLNLPYWYPGAAPVDEFAQREYIETRTGGYGYYWVFPDSRLSSFLPFYRSISDCSLFRGIPVFEQIFSLSMPVWILAFCLTLISAGRKRKLMLPLLPSFFQWLIFIFGPVSNLRYIFPVMLLCPIFLSAALTSEGEESPSIKNF